LRFGFVKNIQAPPGIAEPNWRSQVANATQAFEQLGIVGISAGWFCAFEMAIQDER
jgi:hypothetical protein